MNITFILGNGFDIGLGLKTGYEDFYESYSKLNVSDSGNIIRFKGELSSRNLNYSKKIIDWSDFEKAFGQYSEKFDLDAKAEYIECFEDFVTKFNEYLDCEEKRATFSNTDLIAKTMLSAVTEYFHIREADREYIQKIYKSQNRDRVYNFISFNYTKTIDECANILREHLKSDSIRRVGKILHIHGFIEENMIMGVNDTSQIINQVLAQDEDVHREIVKPRQNLDIRSNYETQVIKTLDDSDIICVYGMSIGETDKKWWSYIGRWLINNEKHALVILKYDKKFNKRFPFNQNKFTDDVVNKFLDLSELNDKNREVVRPRVFVGMNHNVFSMNLCENQDKELASII